MKTTILGTLVLGLLTFGAPAMGNDGSLLRQASHLEDISYEISRELHHAGVYGSLRDDAEKLAREARRFRDALAGRSDRQYLQARYNEMAKYYDRFDRHYRRNHLDYNYRHVDNTYLRITSVFHSISGGYASYTRGWDASRYESDRIVIHRAPPIIYVPFGLQHDGRRYDSGRDHYDERRDDRYNDRYDEHYDRERADRRDERGGRNHYK